MTLLLPYLRKQKQSEFPQSPSVYIRPSSSIFLPPLTVGEESLLLVKATLPLVH